MNKGTKSKRFSNSDILLLLITFICVIWFVFYHKENFTFIDPITASIIFVTAILINTFVHEFGHKKVAEHFGMKNLKIEYIYRLPYKVKYDPNEFSNLSIKKRVIILNSGVLLSLIITIIICLIILISFSIDFGYIILLLVSSFAGGTDDFWKLIKMYI